MDMSLALQLVDGLQLVLATGVEIALIAATVLSAAATVGTAVMNKPPKPPTPKAPPPVAPPTKAPEAAPVKESESLAADKQKRARKAFSRQQDMGSKTLLTGGLGSPGSPGNVAKTLLGGGQ